MNDLDLLNYRPDFERDKHQKTGWEFPEEETTRMELEDGRLDEGLPVSDALEQYGKFKEDFDERVKDLEKELEPMELESDPLIERALQETGHVSKFGALEYKELFEQKESSPGEYLINVLEKRIEEEDGQLDWEIYIEYLEMMEEMRILDTYIETIIYPIFKFHEENIDSLERLKEAEQVWRDRFEEAEQDYTEKMDEYTRSLYLSPDKIPIKRDELHQIEEKWSPFRQENNQIEAALDTVNHKVDSFRDNLEGIEDILSLEVPKEALIEDLVRLSENDEEVNQALIDYSLLLKQSMDADNKQKNELKKTRRNLYSEQKQKRIIEEYGVVNQLYRNHVLGSVHHMKSFQGNTTSLLDEAFNESAKSMWQNHMENREKTYETYLIQISTSQIRNERLQYVGSKHKSRILFNHLYDVYKELN